MFMSTLIEDTVTEFRRRDVKEEVCLGPSCFSLSREREYVATQGFGRD